MQTVTTRAVNVQNKSGIELFEGDAVWQLLKNESFLAAWDKLYGECPWATIFQCRDFVTTWYQTYRHLYLPLLVVSFELNKLNGLLLLAITKDELIIGAGENQAEYQVWLSTKKCGNEFITNALKAVDRRFKGNKIQLKYIPGNAPMQWLQESAEFKNRCVVKNYKQPLIKIEAAHFTAELQKKNRREKINRLKRLGELKFERITDFQTFATVLDQLALQFDFRKRAVFNTSVFQGDQMRKGFLLSLFEKGLLHATLLKVNENIIASNISIAGKHWAHLQGVNTHDPIYARYSPGILHLLMLGKQLAAEEFSVFDLTPGDDPYKGQLATNYIEAYHLVVSSRYSSQVSMARLAVLEQLKKLALRVGLTPSKMKWQTLKLKEQYKHVLSQGLLFSFNYCLAQVGQSQKDIVYALQQKRPVSQEENLRFGTNSLSELLCFDPKGTSKSAWAFFEDAMRRFETGESSYTCCKSGRLLFCAWLSSYKISAEETALILKNIYFHPSIQTNQKEYLAAMVATVSDQTQSELLAMTKANNKSVCRALEAIGFKVKR